MAESLAIMALAVCFCCYVRLGVLSKDHADLKRDFEKVSQRLVRALEEREAWEAATDSSLDDMATRVGELGQAKRTAEILSWRRH